MHSASAKRQPFKTPTYWLVSAAVCASGLVAASTMGTAAASATSPLPLGHYAIIDTIVMPAGSSGDATKITIRDDSIWVVDYNNKVYLLDPYTNTWLSNTPITLPFNSRYYGMTTSDDTVYSSAWPTPSDVVQAFPNTQVTGPIPVDDSVLNVGGSSYAIVGDGSGHVFASVANGGSGDYVARSNTQFTAVDDSVAVPNSGDNYAISLVDDSLYVPRGSGYAVDDSVAVIRASDMTVRSYLSAGWDANNAIAVSSDHQVYSPTPGPTSGSFGSVKVVNGVTGAILGNVSLPERYAYAMASTHDDTVAVVYEYLSVLSPGPTPSLDDSVYLGGAYTDYQAQMAVWDGSAHRGVFYLALDGDDVMSVAPVSASLDSSSGLVTMTVSGPPDAVIDDSTVLSVTVAGAPATNFQRLGGGQYSFNLGSNSSDDVAVRLKGGNAIGVSVASPPTPPTPDPVYPPSAPRDVTAVPGDGQATVSWQAPESAGSFPVTNYQVRTSPGGATCLVAVPTLSCTIAGLTNGTAYTFEVQALNGAGWGAWSNASAPVTPGGSATPSILIVDSRRGTGTDAGRVYANGTSKHLTSATVQTRVKLTGEIDYQDGVVRPLDPDGDFTWTRLTNKRVHVYFQADGVRSNRVIIAAR